MPPHVLIIGAGPAGSACAITLARAGWRATLVESKLFPRTKVCGEFISPAATAILERLLPPADLLAAGARRLSTLTLERGPRATTWRTPTPAWSISRAALDTLLLGRARSAGAEILQPARITAVAYDDSHISATLASGDAITADIAIHADGSGRHDPAGPTPSRRGVVALKCHLRAGSLPVHHLHMRSAPGAYIGLSPVEGDQLTLALVARSQLLAAYNADADTLLAAILPGFSASARTSDWLACGVPASPYITPGHPRSFRIGNAAAAVEPVGGEGIGLALWSGTTLAQLLSHVDASTPALAATQTHLARRYRRRLLTRRPACRAAAAALMRPTLTTALWPTLAIPALSLRPWYALTGKPLATT